MARTDVLTPDEDAALGSPTQEEGVRFRADMRLRMFSFSIHARPNGKPALWERAGKLYTVTQALEVIRREIAAVEGGR